MDQMKLNCIGCCLGSDRCARGDGFMLGWQQLLESLVLSTPLAEATTGALRSAFLPLPSDIVCLEHE